VVRGPQGTLLGKNTTIGVVIVKTAKPSFTLARCAGHLWRARPGRCAAMLQAR
jgi:hypothetical protein